MTYLLMAFILMFTPPVFSERESPIARTVTAVALTRAEFDRLSAELSYQSIDVAFKRFSQAYALDSILANVNERVATDHQIEVNAEEIQAYIKTWIVTLILAKNGFEEAAEKQFFRSALRTGINAETFRQKHGSLPDVNEFLHDVTRWTIAETIAEFGSLNFNETNRLYARLSQSAETLRSVKLRNKIRSGVGKEILNRYSVVPLQFAGCVAACAASVPCLDPVMNFVLDTFGDIVNPEMLQLDTLGGFLIAIVLTGWGIPSLAIFRRAKWRARAPVIRNIADLCEQILVGDGRIRRGGS